VLQYIVRRILLTIPTLALISVIAFTVIQLPPGDYVTSYVARLAARGESVDEAEIAALYRRYGLDRPIYEQYLRWMWNILHGDFGQSFEWNMPVGALIWERLALTVVISFSTLIFVWIIAFPVAIYSATHQYSVGDHVLSLLGFVGLGVPHFMLALLLLWLGYRYFGVDLSGLFSDAYVEAPWSLDKLADMLKHLWVPLLVLGLGGTAGLIRTTRANLLDELHKPYVTTARAKGLTEVRLLLKYPVRVALRPFISTLGWTLPSLVSGSTIVARVLGLPTSGTLFLSSLLAQDMFLAGSFVLMLSTLTVIGTLISDILLGIADPRIRLGAP
jgi:peptide/nickel transport system permease protein